ncbi:MAG: aminofutalosine synthase MqnE [Bacteroidetes bacterium]|nr:aminofutalosine synthase MqnE [Bacteroidota bacterium]MBT6686053.1 aminofutalosine synthase MqnE [Bacteroidota bacterium]MBT7142727.1 aminofutalosine synthase MqnE [Bacteroidota bacterium]MBT7491332.1 aminofutalosine synthase MqnE [Bacteroidota bacterium]
MKIVIPSGFEKIYDKVISNKRIDQNEAMILFEKAEIGFLGILANHIREKKHGSNTFFNRNFHIEPTNICVYNCKFCSYRRRKGEDGSWDYSVYEMLNTAKKYIGKNVSEVHIVGGVHPQYDLFYYANLIKKIKEILPKIHIKAFSAIELEYMISKANYSLSEGLTYLRNHGLDSIPGGGAEIFDENIRTEICDEKASSQQWLTIHENAHKIGISSNATMLYGHIENYSHRVHHLNLLRELQDRTNGFNAFIPLKFKKENNKLSYIKEVNTLEDLRNYAVSRIFLDNIPNIKAYWPMIGTEIAQLSLSFGVNDLDGTIDDSTKIYSMAGAKDKNPGLSSNELIELIKDARRKPVERDSNYQIIKKY